LCINKIAENILHALVFLIKTLIYYYNIKYQRYDAMTDTPNSSLPSYSQLPKTFAISLELFSAISLVGEEQEKYLQGQVTCDINTLEQEKLLHGAHCDAKGKVFSAFRLIQRNNALLLMQPKSSIEKSLAELKKFGVFAKVEISELDDMNFFAIAGENASSKLVSIFPQMPDTLTPVIQHDSTTLVYISGKIERYILIDEPQALTTISKQLSLPVFNQAVWDLLEISEGFPTLSQTAVGEYVPQMLNLQAIKGISFTKGCYLGQETVARMQYLGKNKRALFALSGESSAVKPGDIIEKKLGDNWRKAGDVIAAYQADTRECYLQAVLANDLETNTELRVKEKESQLSLMPLPYTLSIDAD
jgi:folate-binding protein YgfZ